MNSEKFNTYNDLSRKVASAIFQQSDDRLKELIDKSIDSYVNKPGFFNTITRPFKKLYINTVRDDENIIRGLRNIGPEVVNNLKDTSSTIAARDIANQLSKLSLKDKMHYGLSALKSSIGIGDEDIIGKYTKDYLKNRGDYLVNTTTKALKNRSMADLFKALNRGDFNDPVKAKAIAKTFSPDVNKVLPSEGVESKILETVLRPFIKSQLNTVENEINKSVR